MMHMLVLAVFLTLGFTLWLTALIGSNRHSPKHTSHPNRAALRRAMSRLEALRLLGLDDHADPRAIRLAYKRLMVKYHPDHGGSHQAAARLNQAKDVLLRRAK